MRGYTSDRSEEVELPPKGILRRSKEILFGGNVPVDTRLFSGEIEHRTCCVDIGKLRGKSCRSMDGSSALEWPKSTLAVLVLTGAAGVS